MKRAAFARINLSHLKHNFAEVRKLANQSKIMAVVKADAYGHGKLEVCKSLSNADSFSVAYVNEALELRESGIKKEIVALQGFSNAKDLQSAIEQNIQVVIHHQEQLTILKSHAKKTCLNVFLKIDTGMHRLGFAATEVEKVITELKSLLSPDSNIRVMTHLASADETASSATLQQIEQFDSALKKHNFEQSIANSAGILAWPQCNRNWVRPGLVLYGINPLAMSARKTAIELRPVMSLYAPLISVKSCKKGEKVGYGGDFSCPDDMLIGIIAIGYADGYPRHLKQSPTVFIAGKKASVVGRVSMDMIAIDLNGIEAQVGDVAELWGENVSVAEVAEHAETISYELLCAAGNSVDRKYIQ